MSTFFQDYKKDFSYNVTTQQNFDTCLNKFLTRNRNSHVFMHVEFAAIEDFLTYQPAAFFEESFLTTCSKLIENLSVYNDDSQISFAQDFVSMLKKEKFNTLVPKLQDYGTNNTFMFISFLLMNNHISLAENITTMFIHPEKRTLSSFNSSIVDWCLRNTKIAALKFLINHYEGFNHNTVQSLFLGYGQLGENYLSKVFPDNIYPSSFDGSFQVFFKNPSVVLTKKLQLISYFSAKTDFIPKELVSFIYSGLNNHTISIESLKKYDFYDKLTSRETLQSFFPIMSHNYIVNLQQYLTFFEKDIPSENIIFDMLTDHEQKNYFVHLFKDFITTFPKFVKEKSVQIESYIIDNNIDIPYPLLTMLHNNFSFDEKFTDYIINKNPEFYFYLKNPNNEPQYINTTVKYILEKGLFPDLTHSSAIKSIVNELSQQLDNTALVNLFFIDNYLSHNLKFLKNTNCTIVVDLLTISTNDKEKLIHNLIGVLPRSTIEQLQPKKWYQFSSDKPLQIVLRNGDISIIKKTEDLVTIVPVIPTENNSSTSVSSILSQANKDLIKFNQLTSEPLDFNLEFKIRSESIFMQQMNFLTQIQKIENDLKIEDLYFLKNNLGKYLIQCTETYSRALKRHQTLLENPGLFKKQDSTLDSQKEKIDSEALKQVTLLEKELLFVKDNIINTINSDSFSDMRINTRFLEATIEHNDSSIVKLVSKPRS